MRTKWVAIASLLTGAVVWGAIWYPYRVLEQAGLSGVRSAVFSYSIAFCLGLLFFRHSLLRNATTLRSLSMLALIAVVAGGCNLGYVLATIHGQVMRVLLLFYLAPFWTVLLAWLLLAERLTRWGFAVIVLSLTGAATMLWQPDIGVPWPANWAEWFGLVAGFLFALTNVLIRMTWELPIQLKCMAVFSGVVIVGCAVLLFEQHQVTTVATEMLAVHWFLLVVVGIVLLVVNLVVQYGLTHTSANQAIVIFLVELVVAAFSSVVLAGESMGQKEWLGGAMIVAATLFSGEFKMENEG